MKLLVVRFWLVFVLGCSLKWCSSALAQVVEDDTLSTQVRGDGTDFTIDGGKRAGGNLFHSFERFSLPTGGSATFNNAIDVNHIFSRVTGNDASHIDGVIRAMGGADLIMINPRGIIFGPGAELDIGGSFIGSTADRVEFADGTFFSATDVHATPLLTVSAPVGLQFGDRAAPIVSRSEFFDFDTFANGLTVPYGETLALLGGDIEIVGKAAAGNQGGLTAFGGRIILGGVAPGSRVGLAQDDGWSADFSSVREFRNVRIADALVFANTFPTFGSSDGFIELQGQQVSISNTQVSAAVLGNTLGGDIFIRASREIVIDKSSQVLTTVFSGTGSAGDISLVAPIVRVLDESFIFATTQTEGNGGNIEISASELVELAGDPDIGPTLIRADSFALKDNPVLEGDAGTIAIKTGRLIVRDGVLIASSTKGDRFGETGEGSSGSIIIRASESVEISGLGTLIEQDNPLRSGVFATSERTATSDGGSIDIQTPSLSVTDGATIATGTTGVGTTGDGGAIAITADRIIVRDGGQIIASTTDGSTGAGGELTIEAGNVRVSGSGSAIAAESTGAGDAGRVSLDITDDLKIDDGGRLSVSATGTGAPGGLFVTAENIYIRGAGSAIAAENNSSADAGNIKLTATEKLQLEDGGRISVRGTTETGAAGNIELAANRLYLQDSRIDAETAGGRGNIIIRSEDLRLRDGSSISTSATGPADGGNITIGPLASSSISNSVILFDTSTITARAVGGNGGNIFITAETIFFPPGSIDASSEFGIDGNVEIFNPETDPSRSLAVLPSETETPAPLESCGANTGVLQSRFTNLGRGGIPIAPTEAAGDLGVWEDLDLPEAETSSHPGSRQLVEAETWVVDPHGRVRLVASEPTGSTCRLSAGSKPVGLP
ncbi:filamentous hemagglutinin family N-terminal domain protein [Rubidibacter lacunae KORDI 51-2]|uniref:Filamentous hemagglutinin family N-terminal domain protein n=1 Tax=Rubidibacter lacunae KORDI 51-2 TaxID=582515 RepID=U5DK42_9CHRO|nr:filamentous hemagglutinin N-terminal domain-containing protein [Rubidibacter lacunae]ERN42051.1 filamentous hemagglutinin family N-terminal domain protein [Rubidibacter lacunae KORDI 51-2]